LLWFFFRHSDGLITPGLEKMAFEADTCWIQQGGEDVVGYMKKYADRIPLLR